MIYSIIRDNTSNQNIKGSDFHSRSFANLFPMVDLSEYFVIYQATNQLAVFCKTESHILSVISVKYMESRSHLSIRLIFITKLNTKTLIIRTPQSKPNHFIIQGNHYRQISPVFF